MDVAKIANEIFIENRKHFKRNTKKKRIIIRDSKPVLLYIFGVVEFNSGAHFAPARQNLL